MNIIEKRVNEIIPYEKNPRKNDEAVKYVAESIKQFGFKVPIVIDKNNVIIAGHTRHKAAKKLNLKTAPCIIADDLTEEQIKAFRLADNKVSEMAEWDFGLLEEELEDIFDIDMEAFGFDLSEEETSYEEKMMEFQQKMSNGELSDDDEEYQEFLQKFEAKKTTDDCYTPTVVYEAVANYVEKKYGVSKNNFVRPFYPGGDYQSENYKSSDIVVDNPPFSIMSEILNFYNDNGIKFFLFAPHLTIFSSCHEFCSFLLCGVSVTYENGANVCTSFITNMEDCQFRSCPELYRAVKEANDVNLKSMRKELPKYSYPMNVVMSPMIASFSRCGLEFEVSKNECYFIRSLDSQKECNKGLFGSGFLISDKKRLEREKLEREKLEREKAQAWELSGRELDIISGLE